MAMPSFAPFISRRLLLPFLLSPRPPARHWFVFSGGLLQLHRHPSPASSSSCRQQPQLVPGTDAEEEAGAEQQGKKALVARRQAVAAPRAPRPSTPKKPTKKPAPPGGPKEGRGGNGGVIHAAPASSSSLGVDKKVEEAK